jgi:cellulose synthase/poly-beta-1,6-N-acetylglucosamine synthase-like glycosyltransferase
MSGSTVLPLMEALLIATAIVVSLPLVVLGVECLAAMRSRRVGELPQASPRPRLAVLIPAHNEETTLGSTLDAIVPQLLAGERLLVVADNCDDNTAAVARAHGADVVERFDASHLGKGYALDFGMKQLEADPPEVVVLTDADCIMNVGAIDALIQQVAATGRPAQALYLLEQPTPATLRDSISAFAFLLKNQVRPIGLQRLGMPCPLFGAGMAFPWQVLRDAPLADGNIVEDLQLGLNLVRSGFLPTFCQSARVIGNLPTDGEAALTQRRRWEHGHLRTIVSQVPKLIATALTRRSLAPFVVAMDVSVPPLSLLTVAVGCVLGLCVALAAAGGSRVPLIVLASAALFTAISLGCVWLKYGRQTLPARSLLAVPFYVAWKVPMYFAFVLRPQKQWVRTPRGAEPAQAAPQSEAPDMTFGPNESAPTTNLPR